jgi:hypothetical protein
MPNRCARNCLRSNEKPRSRFSMSRTACTETPRTYARSACDQGCPSSRTFKYQYYFVTCPGRGNLPGSASKAGSPSWTHQGERAASYFPKKASLPLSPLVLLLSDVFLIRRVQGVGLSAGRHRNAPFLDRFHKVSYAESDTPLPNGLRAYPYSFLWWSLTQQRHRPPTSGSC